MPYVVGGGLDTQFLFKYPIRMLRLVLLFGFAMACSAESSIEKLLTSHLINSNLPMEEVQRFAESRVPTLPTPKSLNDWEAMTKKWREDTINKIVLRGQAKQWAKQKTQVEWLDTIPGGEGYSIKKLRYEVAPGMWIPALLYVPNNLTGKVPVAMAVNGHEGAGKSIPYKQIRCINMAKRGMLVLNVEWLGMGQLRGPELEHYKMNQLDLCGTSGLAPFYFSLKRGLDILLEHPNADHSRVSVSGLSGGSWQTIFISALDERVTYANPVAGYSSFKTRARFLQDLGDSEQTPSDLATVVDYTHLTAMRAPRPTLLTYNAKDNCCFAAPHALPPLLAAAGPIYKLYGAEDKLRWHINYEPGDHNFGLDNREAFYSSLSDYFFNGESPKKEIPSENEVKSDDDLFVELPASNQTFNSLAKKIAESLPKTKPSKAKLNDVIKPRIYEVTPQRWEQKLFLKMGGDWTVPAVEINPAGEETALVIADFGKANMVALCGKLAGENKRVIALDPFYFGESKIRSHDFLFAMLVAAVGERPLGIQAGQIISVAKWAGAPVSIHAEGPRTSLIALCAAALEPAAVKELHLKGLPASFKELIDKNIGVNQQPEMFCFGLLEAADIPDLLKLVQPRKVTLN